MNSPSACPLGLLDLQHLQTACDLAQLGQGFVEPNPLVGCLIVQQDQILARGWHRRFGGNHAEVEALDQLAGNPAQIARWPDRSLTMYITLEPCCHYGKTPPCTNAILATPAIGRVVVGAIDPNPLVAGQGIALLRQSGVVVDYIPSPAVDDLNAPFQTYMLEKRPWVHGKWAMSWDGKIASQSGHSRWITSDLARQRVHELRSRIDGIVVGIGTVLADDPLLTPRNVEVLPRQATRIVLDSLARIPLTSQLVQSAREYPLLILASPDADAGQLRQLEEAGAHVYQCLGDDHLGRLRDGLHELRRRQFTHLLVEGGSRVLGTFLDANLLDEVHVMMAPKLLGGSPYTPTSGKGIVQMPEAWRLKNVNVETLGPDIYLRGRVAR